MSVIARVTVDSVDFAIGDAFASVTDVHVDAEGVVPVSVGLVTYFWIGGTVDKRVVDPLRDDDRVDAVSVVDGLEDRLLIRVDWDIERDAFLDTVDDTAGVVLEAHRESDRWSFILPAITSWNISTPRGVENLHVIIAGSIRLRFDDYDALSAFSRRCRDEGVDLELEQVHNPAYGEDQSTTDLTPAQHEVLVAAIEGGYFEVPRETTLVELGDQLDISDSAVSQRLRRGLATLLSANLSERSGDVG